MKLSCSKFAVVSIYHYIFIILINKSIGSIIFFISPLEIEISQIHLILKMKVIFHFLLIFRSNHGIRFYGLLANKLFIENLKIHLMEFRANG